MTIHRDVSTDGVHGFVLSSWVESCLKGFELKGWDIQELFAVSGVDPLDLRQPRCSIEAINALFKSAETLFKTPTIGLAARRGITPFSFQSISLASMASANLWDGLACMVRFNRCITNVVRFSLDREGDSAVFACHRAEGAPESHPLALDAVLSTTMKTCRFIHPSPAAVQCIEIGRPAPPDSAAFVHYFKAPICWNADRYAIHLDPDYLEKPSMHFNPVLLAEYERMCFEQFPEAHGLAMAEKVRNYLRQHLHERDLNLATVAKALAVSQRSLQRHLNEQQTSFRKLLNDTLKKESIRLLSMTSMSIAQVAYALGFNDSSNFSRAFKRWLNCSPKAYR